MAELREALRQYEEELRDLKQNLKPEITNLSVIAGEIYSQHGTDGASAVCAAVERRIRTAPPNEKLPAIYLLDSIVKKLKEPFTSSFASSLPELFREVYPRADDNLKRALERLVDSWQRPTLVFPQQTIEELNSIVGNQSSSTVSQGNFMNAAAMAQTGAWQPQGMPMAMSSGQMIPMAHGQGQAVDMAGAFGAAGAQGMPMQGMQIPVQMQMQMGMQAPNAVPMPGQMQSMGFFPGMSGEWNQGSLPRSKGRGGGSRARGGGSRGAGRGASHGRGTSEHWSVQAHKRKRPGTQDASVAGKQQKRSQEDINTFVQTLLSGERRGQGTDQQEAPSTSGAAGERSYEPPSRSERTGESWPQDFANRKSLRERHEAVVRSLYDDLPHQCQQTGLRFGESSSYSSHLDALILRRKRQKDTTMSSRSWYVTLEQWILGTSRGHTDERFAEGDHQENDQEHQGQNKADESVSEPADELQPCCALSGEQFETFWHHEKEEWHYKGAVRLRKSVHGLPPGSLVLASALPESLKKAK